MCPGTSAGRSVTEMARKILTTSPGGGGALGFFWVGMCRPGLQIGTPFLKKNSPKTDTPF